MAIKVLMFGWELPPHNSGGLGTASLGLTEGLASLGLDISFVIPKTFGSYPFSHMEIISAADVSSPEEVERFLRMNADDQALAAHSLGYGNYHTSVAQRLSINQQKRLLLDGIFPLRPKVQANWYAHQAGAIAQRNPHFDLIHGHDWFTYYGGLAAKKVAHEQGREVPFVAQVHATEIDRCGSNGDSEILEIERRGLHGADHVITVSHYTKEVVHQHYDIPRSKISVVYNGVPTHKQPELYDLHELKKHHKIVLFMGRITYQKGPDYFVKLARAVTDVDPSVRFVMVGTGDMEKRCIEESARQGLTGKMLFSSFLRGADVDRAYQLADLFVMPSVSEPFGIVALEAIQNGTPALVSKQSGVAEVSENLIKVDFWDIDRMRDTVIHVLREEDYAQTLRQGGKADLTHLSWKDAATTMRGVYESVLQQPQFTSLNA